MASQSNPRATAGSQDDSDIVTRRRIAKQRVAHRNTWPFCARTLQAIPEHNIMEWSSPEPSTAEEESPTQALKLKRKSKVIFNSPTLPPSAAEDCAEFDLEDSPADLDRNTKHYKNLPPTPSSKKLSYSTTTNPEEPEKTAELGILRAQVVWCNYHIGEAQAQERRLENKIAELEKVCKSQARVVDKLSDQMNLWQTSHDIIETELEEAMEDIEQAKIYVRELELANANLRVQMSRTQQQKASASPEMRFFSWLRTLLPKKLFKMPERKTP